MSANSENRIYIKAYLVATCEELKIRELKRLNAIKTKVNPAYISRWVKESNGFMRLAVSLTHRLKTGA